MGRLWLGGVWGTGVGCSSGGVWGSGVGYSGVVG